MPAQYQDVNALGIIRLGLQAIGRLPGGLGAEIDPDLAQDALTLLNEMIDNWRTQRLLIGQLTRKTRAVTANTTSVTIGPGGDIDMMRPYAIQQAKAIDLGQTVERPLDIWDRSQYAGYAYKSMTSALIGGVYYDPTDTPVLGKITLGPIPTQGLTLVLYVLAPLSGFTDLTTKVQMLPGAAMALRTNFSIHAAPFHGVSPERELKEQAITSKADLKRLNIQHPILANPFGGRGSYNIWTDETVGR